MHPHAHVRYSCTEKKDAPCAGSLGAAVKGRPAVFVEEQQPHHGLCRPNTQARRLLGGGEVRTGDAEPRELVDKRLARRPARVAHEHVPAAASYVYFDAVDDHALPLRVDMATPMSSASALPVS